VEIVWVARKGFWLDATSNPPLIIAIKISLAALPLGVRRCFCAVCQSHFFLVFQEFRYADFTVLGIWLFGPSNRLTRYDWDRLPNARDDFFELSEFPDSSFFSTRILVRVQ
jgi:hypothetical protein